jgi:4-amino-4-deoxy-L-arabinose transferase-like glycosyltransferase
VLVTRMDRFFSNSAVEPGPLAATADYRFGAALAPSERAIVVGLFTLLSATYLYAAIAQAIADHFWLDEVLAVTAARQPTLSGVWHAIWSGTDFSPPTYHYLLHGLVRIFGAGGRLIWRLPSIAAIYGAAVCTYLLLVRCQVSRLAAVLGFGIVLSFGLFDYAIQARPYALLSFCLAAALLLWSSMDDARGRALRAFGLWLVLAVALALHFYGVIEVAVIGIAESIYWLGRRRLRKAVWLALAMTAPIELALYPLAAHLAQFSGADSTAAGYYGQPAVGRLVGAVFEIVGGGMLGSLMLLAAALIIGLAQLLKTADESPPKTPVRPSRAAGLSELQIVIISLCALPFVTFAFSLIVTKSFSARYMSSAALLPAIAAACLVDRLPTRRVVTLTLVPVIAGTGVLFNRVVHAADPTGDALAVAQRARPPLPIVVGEGLLYIQLMEAADPATRARLVYLKRPEGVVSPDPTNENEVLRLATFLPDYHVSEQAAFLDNTPAFYTLYRPNASTDTTTPSLIAAGVVGVPVYAEGGLLLFRASAARSARRGGAR